MDQDFAGPLAGGRLGRMLCADARRWHERLDDLSRRAPTQTAVGDTGQSQAAEKINQISCQQVLAVLTYYRRKKTTPYPTQGTPAPNRGGLIQTPSPQVMVGKGRGEEQLRPTL